MAKVLLDMAMSLDGFIVGPNGDDAGLNDWFFEYFSNNVSGNRDIAEESIKTIGAIIMGRRTYDYADRQDAFEGNPYIVPHFVITHHVPEKVAKGTTAFTFVTDGIESALTQAKAAAGDKYVALGGGANISQQYIKAGLIDEIQIHLVPIILSDGIRLFEHSGAERMKLATTRVIESSGVTHLRFNVVR